MKDYIYLDENLLSSNLAQLHAGLPKKSTVEQETGTTKSNIAEEAASKGLNGLFGFGSEYIKQNMQSDSFEIISSQKEVLESVFHDYAVDLLINSIPEYQPLADSLSESQEGDFILVKDYFDIYDFDHISKTIDIEKIKPFMQNEHAIELEQLKAKKKRYKQIKKKNSQISRDLAIIEREIKKIQDEHGTSDEDIKDIEMIKTVADYFNNLFPNSTVIRVNGGLIFAKRSSFRNISEQTSLLTDSKRKISIIGIISSVKEKTYQENSLEDFSPDQLNKIPSMIVDIMLSSFGIMKDGDKLIKPIAIFFE